MQGELLERDRPSNPIEPSSLSLVFCSVCRYYYGNSVLYPSLASAIENGPQPCFSIGECSPVMRRTERDVNTTICYIVSRNAMNKALSLGIISLTKEKKK